MVDPPSAPPVQKPAGVQRAHWRGPADIWQRGWDNPSLLLAFYLLFCPLRTMEGLYWLPKAVIADGLKWTPEELEAPFQFLEGEGFLKYDDHFQIVFMREALQVQNTSNPNMCINGIRRLKRLQPTPLFDDLLAVAEAYDPRLAQAMLKEMPERFSKG
jgi:hypothetical protein